MTCVITKISYSKDEHDELSEWQNEMNTYIDGLHEQFIKKYGNDARPTILAISQDMSKSKREENKPGTEQNKIMRVQIEALYAKTFYKFKNNDFMDVSKLDYIFSMETAQLWLEEKSKLRKSFKAKLEKSLEETHIRTLTRTALEIPF